MAWIQNIKPPANQILNYSIQDFSGGLNNRSALVAPNQANEIVNMKFYDNTVLEKRNGTVLYDSYTHPESITHIHEFMPYTGSNQLIRSGASQMQVDKGDGTTFGAWINFGGMDGENFQGKYFYVDGNNTNGLTVYGKFPTSSSTFVRIIGTPVTDFSIMSVVSTPAVYTPLDETYTQGVTVYDYSNAKIWYEPCANEKGDPYKGVSVVPTGVRYITSLNGRLYMSGANRDNDNVFISEIANPYYFPPTLPIQIPPNSDRVMGLVTYDNSVVVGRTRDIHIITGTTNNPELGLEVFQLQKLNTHTGFTNNKAVNVAHNYLFFVGYDGECYALSSARNDAKILATTLLTKTLSFRLAPYNFQLADVQASISYFHEGLWYVSMKDKVFIYNYNIQAWTMYTGLNVRSFYNKDGTLLMGTSAGTTIVFDTGYLDQGVPFQAYWKSGLLDFGDAITYKQFRDMFIVGHTFPGYTSNIRVGFELDWLNLDGSFTTTNQQAIWGVAKFGDKFNPKPINPSAPITIGRRARTMRLMLKNGYAVKGTLSTSSLLPTNNQDEDMYYVTDIQSYYVYNADAMDGNGAWNVYTAQGLNQPMRIYQVSGEYELRGKR